MNQAGSTGFTEWDRQFRMSVIALIRINTKKILSILQIL